MLECWIISSHEVGGRNVNSFYTLRLCVFAGDILTALHQRLFQFFKRTFEPNSAQSSSVLRPAARMPCAASSSSRSWVSPVTPTAPRSVAILIADQHAAALGKDLIVGSAHQILHEQRPLLRAHAHQR